MLPDMEHEPRLQRVEESTEPIMVQEGRGPICRNILESLPDWFGIPATIDTYTHEVDALPMFASRSLSGDVMGFISLKSNAAEEYEIYVMGVKPDAQGHGIGTKLMEAAEAYARERGATSLVVKTLGPSHEDVHYAATRSFYEKAGFIPVGESTEEWGPENPCLLMRKQLD